jgi:murein L,D-transpeptidase YcbB/YkuD
VIAAVERFQKEHHQKVNGKIDAATVTQLAVAMRRHEQNPQNA